MYLYRTRLLPVGLITSVCAIAAVPACSPTKPPCDISSAPTQREFTMQEGIPLPVARGGHAAGVVDGFPVVAGGNNWNADRTVKHWLKDCVIHRDGKWTAGPDLPHPIAYGMFAHGPRGLYLAGGTDGTHKFGEVYHLRHVDGNAGWNKVCSLPKSLSAGGAAIVSGSLYVTCGEMDEQMTNAMWSLNLEDTDAKWRELPPLPGLPRAFPAVAAVGKHLYVLGGLLSMTPPLHVQKDAYRYDTERDTWTSLPDLPRSGYAWSAAPVDARSLLVAGRADGKIHRDILLLDLESLEMKEIGLTVIPTTTAPLIQVGKEEWWLIGGEPDSNKTRTNRITVIHLRR